MACLLKFLLLLVFIENTSLADGKRRTKVKWQRVKGASYYIVINIRADGKGFRLQTEKSFIYLTNIPKKIGVWAYSAAGDPIARPDLVLYDLKRRHMVRKSQLSLRQAPHPPTHEELLKRQSFDQLDHEYAMAFDAPPFRRFDFGFMLGIERLKASAGSSSLVGDSGVTGLFARAIFDSYQLAPKNRWRMSLSAQFYDFRIKSSDPAATDLLVINRNRFAVGFGYDFWHKNHIRLAGLLGWGIVNVPVLTVDVALTSNKTLSSIPIHVPLIGFDLIWELTQNHAMTLQVVSLPLSVSDSIDTYVHVASHLGYDWHVFDLVTLSFQMSSRQGQVTYSVVCPSDQTTCTTVGKTSVATAMIGVALGMAF